MKMMIFKKNFMDRSLIIELVARGQKKKKYPKTNYKLLA